MKIKLTSLAIVAAIAALLTSSLHASTEELEENTRHNKSVLAQFDAPILLNISEYLDTPSLSATTRTCKYMHALFAGLLEGRDLRPRVNTSVPPQTLLTLPPRGDSFTLGGVITAGPPIDFPPIATPLSEALLGRPVTFLETTTLQLPSGETVTVQAGTHMPIMNNCFNAAQLAALRNTGVPRAMPPLIEDSSDSDDEAPDSEV